MHAANQLQRFTVTDLCNFVGLGYHRDPQTRAAFMEVLTKILQQGTEFETLAETALAERYEKLVDLVTMVGDKVCSNSIQASFYIFVCRFGM